MGGRTFDALVFGYYDGAHLLYAARTCNGFTPALREALVRRFRGLEQDTCPLANLPEANSGRWGPGPPQPRNCIRYVSRETGGIEKRLAALSGGLFFETARFNHSRSSPWPRRYRQLYRNRLLYRNGLPAVLIITPGRLCGEQRLLNPAFTPHPSIPLDGSER